MAVGGWPLRELTFRDLDADSSKMPGRHFEQALLLVTLSALVREVLVDEASTLDASDATSPLAGPRPYGLPDSTNTGIAHMHYW